MKNIFIIFFCVVAVVFFAANMAYADSYHITETVESSTTIQSSEGVASAIAAAQHNYYWGKSELQGSAAIGSFDNKTAFSFGLAKKYKKTLINGSISNENGKIGAGLGVNFIF